MGNNKKTMSFDDFVAYREMHNYIFLPSRAPWPAASIDANCRPCRCSMIRASRCSTRRPASP